MSKDRNYISKTEWHEVQSAAEELGVKESVVIAAIETLGTNERAHVYNYIKDPERMAINLDMHGMDISRKELIEILRQSGYPEIHFSVGLKFKNDVLEWAKERNLLEPYNRVTQYIKSVSELGELGDCLIKGDQEGIIDGIGDTLVTLIILAAQCGYDIEDCLEAAYNEIKNRKGKTVNGTFIKE